MKTTLQALLSTGQAVVADGGMGTMLFSAGMQRGQAPETWNAEKPDVVRDIHRAYVEAGAQIILTNTFGGNRVRLGTHNLAKHAVELNKLGAALAREAADAAAQPVVVGGSMGPSGELLEPLGTLSPDEAVSAFEEQARALADGGVDVFWIETMSDLEEVRAAVTGCRNSGANLPIVTTMTFDTKGRTMMGVRPEQAVEALNELGVIALGTNCGNGPDEVEAVVEKMHLANPNIVLIAKSNAGLPHIVDGQAVYDATPADMADYAQRALQLGARVIGACCGSTPEHIQAIATALQEKTV
ncbi:MAG: betaine--homocysteine S-methyltransferase [Anaerolineae bacterium]|nr:betaine--homocysteine S-methyltransferase [Anaerolineae bacterium]